MFSDAFRGFSQETLGSFTGTSQQETCWLGGLELFTKVGIVAPYAVRTQDWDLFVSAGNTAIKLVYPISLDCLTTTDNFVLMGTNFTQTLLNDTEIIMYNLAYHAGTIYEDVMYLLGRDIVYDEIDPISSTDVRDKYF